MKGKQILIETKSKIYPIYFGNEILKLTGKIIKKKLLLLLIVKYRNYF